MSQEIEQRPSPNFKKQPGRQITCIVIHATATKGIASPLEWLCSKESKVSAHYLIGLDGKVYQLVQDMDQAWHAGESEWRGQKWVNSFSIGIELVNPNDGQTPYPDAQIDSVTELCSALVKRYGIHVDNIVAHYDVAPGRKNDPAGFDFAALRGALS